MSKDTNELTLWTPGIYFESPSTKPNCLRVHQPSPKAKLFSLQMNNQSKILFRRFLPFALSFQLCSGPGGVHRDL